jgi:arsenate reductase (glutaredoxin)
MPLIVYGIKNCNTVKSALNWLQENQVNFEFHDFKSRGISESKLVDWCRQIGWEGLVNKRGTTWRQLSRAIQEKVNNQSTAIALMQEKTSVIKRPVLESGKKILAVGFHAQTYSKVFGEL